METQGSKKRYLSLIELNIVLALIDAGGNQWEYLKKELDKIFVYDMNDGGMGSIIFYQPDIGSRSLGKKISEAEFIDSDGVVVSLVLNADTNGSILELDSWKADFKPRISLPHPNDLKYRTL